MKNVMLRMFAVAIVLPLALMSCSCHSTAAVVRIQENFATTNTASTLSNIVGQIAVDAVGDAGGGGLTTGVTNQWRLDATNAATGITATASNALQSQITAAVEAATTASQTTNIAAYQSMLATNAAAIAWGLELINASNKLHAAIIATNTALSDRLIATNTALSARILATSNTLRSDLEASFNLAMLGTVSAVADASNKLHTALIATNNALIELIGEVEGGGISASVGTNIAQHFAGVVSNGITSLLESDYATLELLSGALTNVESWITDTNTNIRSDVTSALNLHALMFSALVNTTSNALKDFVVTDGAVTNQTHYGETAFYGTNTFFEDSIFLSPVLLTGPDTGTIFEIKDVFDDVKFRVEPNNTFFKVPAGAFADTDDVIGVDAWGYIKKSKLSTNVIDETFYAWLESLSGGDGGSDATRVSTNEGTAYNLTVRNKSTGDALTVRNNEGDIVFRTGTDGTRISTTAYANEDVADYDVLFRDGDSGVTAHGKVATNHITENFRSLLLAGGVNAVTNGDARELRFLGPLSLGPAGGSAITLTTTPDEDLAFSGEDVNFRVFWGSGNGVWASKFEGNGSELTDLDAEKITSGILDPERLHSSVALDSEVTAAISALSSVYQPLDADLTDLADGSLSGSKVGSGINADNITTGTLPSARIASGSISTNKIDSTFRDWVESKGGGGGGGIELSDVTELLNGWGIGWDDGNEMLQITNVVIRPTDPSNGVNLILGEGNNSVAIGGEATGSEAIAIGPTSFASEQSGIALGHSAVSEGDYAIAVGTLANVGGDYAIGIGYGVAVTVESGVAIGSGASTSGQDSVAVGTPAYALHDNSVALGAGATTTANDQIMLGTDSHTVHVPGSLSLAGTATMTTTEAQELIVTTVSVSTNEFSGTVVDFSDGSESTITLSGNLTFTGISGFNPTGYNAKIIHVFPGGSNRTIGAPNSWRKSRSTMVVTNNTMANFLVEAQIGFFTNIFQIDAY